MKSIIALAFTIMLGLVSAASALEGYDGDNNSVPGTINATQGRP